MAAERLIARSELDEARAASQKTKAPARAKKTGNKIHIARWFSNGITSIIVTGWAHRTYGFLAAGGFVSWRIWRFFKLGSILGGIYPSGTAAFQAVNDFEEGLEFLGELYENGDLEKILEVSAC